MLITVFQSKNPVIIILRRLSLKGHELKQQTIIRKCMALMLLVIFTISITPKPYFHNVFAKHQDKGSCSDTYARSHFHSGGLNCHFDTTVVIAPYCFEHLPVYFEPFEYLQTFPSSFSSIKVSPPDRSKENRGPPLV